MSNEIYRIIFLLAMGQGLLLAGILLTRKQGDLRANKILAIYVVAMIVPLWNGYVRLLAAEYSGWGLNLLGFWISWFYGPLLYLYCLQKTKSDPLKFKSITPHLASPILGALVIWPGLAYFPVIGEIPLWQISMVPLFAFIFGYIYLSIKQLKQLEKDVELNLSSIESFNIDWLKLLVYGFAFIFFVDLVITALLIIGFAMMNLTYPILTFVESVYIFVIGMFSLGHPRLLLNKIVVSSVQKYDFSPISKELAAQLVEQLNHAMTVDELYLNNEISLQSLAEHLKINPRYLSQVLNEALGQSFYDYINQARIERAQAMLIDPGFSDLAIMDVAYQVGFNNKTSFNNAFKKYAQQTPSQFRLKKAS